MHDCKKRYEKLLADADDCDLIANLSTDAAKRAAFRKIAQQCRAMAAELKQTMGTLAEPDAPLGQGS